MKTENKKDGKPVQTKPTCWSNIVDIEIQNIKIENVKIENLKYTVASASWLL